MIELRWLKIFPPFSINDGTGIVPYHGAMWAMKLQYREATPSNDEKTVWTWSEWKDVPIVEED